MRIESHFGQRRRSDGNIYITIVLTLCLAWPNLIARAQSGAGLIQGTITDSMGAAIPNAAIQVKNLDTGVTTDTKSNGVGFYQVPDLFTGRYSMTVGFSGMKTFATSIELLVGQTAMINPVLSPGAVTQQVTVNADSVQLATTDSGVLSSILERNRIEQIPIDGRLLITLVGLTTPGMEATGGRTNGLTSLGTVYVIDGATSRSDLSGDISNNKTQLIDPDSIQEVRAETMNSSAQFASPATVVATTKSGTNKLRGTLFETARNNAFGVARRRQDPVNYSAPHLVRNEFGISAGGPIVLPHVYHGKDKSFWFFAFERYSLASNSSTLTTVPTMAMRQGDFSGLVTTANVLQVLYDPATTTSNNKCPIPVTGPTYATSGTTKNAYCRAPFPNNVIPASQMSPLAKIYYKLLPAPNKTDNPLVESNYSALNPQFQTIPQFSLRLDHVFSEQDRTYLRYSYNHTDINTSGGPRNLAVSDSGVDIPAGAAYGYSNNPNDTHLAAIGHTHVFSPTFYSETVLSQQWFANKTFPGVAANKNYESMLNLPNNFGETGFPSIGTNLITNLGSSQTGNPQIIQLTTSLDENLTKTIDKHQLQFGGRIVHSRDTNHPNGNADDITLGANPVALYNPGSGVAYNAYKATGYADASMFLGSMATYNVNLQPPVTHYRYWQIAGYLQDNYHYHRNLTFNVGLRWEARPALWTKDGLNNSFDLKNDAMVLGAPISELIAKGYTTQSIITNDQWIGMKFETAQQAGMPSKLMRDYNLNILPRVGFAYLPFGDKWGTVLRGAYGRYLYANPLNGYATPETQNNPYVASWTRSFASIGQAVDALPNEYLRYNGPVKFGVAGQNTANVVDTTSTTTILPGDSGPFSTDPNWSPAFITEVNFTVEQPLKGHSTVRASYVWTHGSHLGQTVNYNQALGLYQWEMATGTAQPNGAASVIGTPLQNTYAATAMRPYDNTTWGDNSWHTRSGWSNYNALQVAYQRLFHHGYAYQLTYVWSKAMFSTGAIAPLADYPGILGSKGIMSLASPVETAPYAGVAPPALPSGTTLWANYHALDYYEQYQVDTGIPTMHIRFNWVVDVPVGRGKKFFGRSSRWLDEIIGGYQLAGSGNIYAGQLQPTSGSNWGMPQPLQIYKHKKPVTDCTSGTCYKEYLWFNGYQAPSAVAGTSYGTCTSGKCITGMPADYVPVQAPMDNTPGDTYYQTNDVNVQLLDGTSTVIGYGSGPTGSNYLSKSYIHGPINWPVDMSLFKVFPITERVRLRVNLDAFNAFNMPGENNPGVGGLQKFLTSNNNPRELQITARLSF